MKTSGFDQLQKVLAEAQTVFVGLDSAIGEIVFDPSNPESVASAVAQMESAVDERAEPYVARNPLVRQASLAIKEEFRAQISRAMAPDDGPIEQGRSG